MPDINMFFKVINWNIGGAKFLELESNSKWEEPIDGIHYPSRSEPKCREEYQWRLKQAFTNLLETEDPHVVTLQEVVQYEENGDFSQPKNIVDPSFFDDLGYKFLFTKLIDTVEFSAQEKWHRLRGPQGKSKKSIWKKTAYFAQGNAVLVKKNIKLFPIKSIPKLNISYKVYQEVKNPVKIKKLKKYIEFYNPLPIEKHKDILNNSHIDLFSSTEIVYVKKGLYFGDRNTEPRAAIVTHIVTDGSGLETTCTLSKPLDIFVINLHLSTFSSEREGVPSKDKMGSLKRIEQLDIVFDDIISEYNLWRQEKEYGFGKKKHPITRVDTIQRHNPVWIIAGDFNFTPESSEYEYIMKRNFVDLIPVKQPGTKADSLAKAPTLTVDYIFAGPLYRSIHPDNAKSEIEQKQNRVVAGNYAKVSDHMPLIATVPILIKT